MLDEYRQEAEGMVELAVEEPDQVDLVCLVLHRNMFAS